MEEALIIARENVKATLAAITNSPNSTVYGCDANVIAASKISYHSKFKSVAHRAQVIAWQEVANG